MIRLALVLAMLMPIKGQGYKFNRATIERMKRKRAATIARKEREAGEGGDRDNPAGQGSGKVVKQARILGSAKTEPVYDSPAPLKGKQIGFSIGTKDGKRKSLYWDHGETSGEGPDKIVMGPKGAEDFDEPDSVITGTFTGAGFTIAEKGSWRDKKPLTDSDLDAIAAAAPDGVFFYAGSKNYVKRDGKLESVKPLSERDAGKARGALEKITGRKSSWNGKLERGIILRKTDGTPMDIEVKANGIAHPNGTIGLAEKVMDGKVGPATLTHELFHTLSGPDPSNKNYGAVIRAKGYEEGVVEMLARLHTPDTARAMYPNASEAEIQAYAEVGSAYSEYTEPLEGLRERLGTPPKEFYGFLLSLEPGERRDAIAQKADAELSGDALLEFRAAHTEADKALMPDLLAKVGDILAGKS